MSGNCERRLGRGTCDPQGCPDVGRATGSAGTETARSTPRGARPRGRDTTAEQERRQAPGTRAGRPVLSPAARRAAARGAAGTRRAASASAIVTRTKRAVVGLHLADQVQAGADDRADRRERRLGRGTCDPQGCPDVGRATGSAGTETARNVPAAATAARSGHDSGTGTRGRQAPGTRAGRPVLSPAARRAAARGAAGTAASASDRHAHEARAVVGLHLADQVRSALMTVPIVAQPPPDTASRCRMIGSAAGTWIEPIG